MATSLSRLRRLYAQAQPAGTLLTVPNSSGAATLAVGDYVPHTSFRHTLSTALLRSADKNGTRTQELGVRGRSTVNWSLQGDLRARGDASGLPPLNVILAAVFGAPATTRAAAGGSITGATNASPIVITQVAHGFATGDVVRTSGIGGNKAANGAFPIIVLSADTYSLVGSSGSGAYTSGGTSARSRILYRLADDILSFVAGYYCTPSTLQQDLVYGAVARQLTLRLGQDVASVSAEGMASYVLDSDTFSGEDVDLQGGLTSFPTEPTGSLPADGGITAGFTGRFVVGSSTISTIRSAEVQISTGNQLVGDNFGRFTANETEGDIRTVGLTLSHSKTDDAGSKALYAAAKSKTPLDVVLQIGTAQYKTFVMQLKGIQLDTSDEDDSQLRVVRSYSNCIATGSAPGALDEIKLDIL